MIYHEDGMTFEVEVLENNSNEYFERYKLKVIKIISNKRANGTLCEVAKVGYVFVCQRRYESFYDNTWNLSKN